MSTQMLPEPATTEPGSETQELSRYDGFADYEDLSQAVDQAYDTIADDADALFERIATQTDTVRDGRIDVELRDDGSRAVYRTEQEQGGQTTTYRHVPSRAWDGFAQEVYAPLVAFQTVMDDASVEDFAAAYGLSADADMYEWAAAIQDAEPQNVRSGGQALTVSFSTEHSSTATD